MKVKTGALVRGSRGGGGGLQYKNAQMCVSGI